MGGKHDANRHRQTHTQTLPLTAEPTFRRTDNSIVMIERYLPHLTEPQAWQPVGLSEGVAVGHTTARGRLTPCERYVYRS